MSSPMTCPACGTDNPTDRKFCGECGARLAVACASCGTPLLAGQKFCGECGTSTTGAAPATSAAVTAAAHAPVAERRLVTVLFADLVGFTPFAEEHDSEDVRETLTRYFELAREAVERHGGTVEKFIGDAVMAVWGAPVAHEDDAERAVRAAFELLDAVHVLGPGITARAGVLTGEAAVTLGASGQGMVAGDLVNTAARLQSVAPPGTVVVGEATYRAASAAIAFEEIGEQTLKGKASPVPAWRALRVVAERGGRGRGDAVEAPFVGRDDELRLLKEIFHQCSREGRARVVSVTGPAGIGKSRLGWEFAKYLDGVVEPIWWHQGRAPSYGGGLPFWALGEMIRGRCGLAESADEPTTRAAVASMLAREIADPTERAWIEPALLALLGIDSAAVATDELFARWRLLFERLAATGTVVMVFEDLQWADGGTIEFISHLLDWSKACPILVVALARPELLDARPDWGAGRRQFAAVALDPLPEPAMRQLLAGLVPDLPEAAVRQIVARAEGIPLYAVETIRMLVTDRRLVLDGGHYQVAGDISSLAVPETLTALIASRLDALDPDDRSLILDAAVLGQQFTVEALAAVSGQSASDLEPRLLGLVRRELLTVQADPRSPDRGQYGFVQGLIREVAYNTLARRDRLGRHLAAARYFERLDSDELAGALAGHYLAACENAAAGAEADALAAQARMALRDAAERAVALGSHAQAVTLLRQALTVTDDRLDRADLLERLGVAAVQAGAYADARSALEEALQIQRAVGEREAGARLSRRFGESLLYAGQYTEGRDVLAAAVAAYGDLGQTPEMTALRGQLARALYLADEYREAIALADAVLETAEREELPEILADTLITKGTALANLGRPEEGVGVVAVGLRVAEANELSSSRLRAMNNIAAATAEADLVRSLQATRDGLALARRLGSGLWLRGLTGNLGFVAFRTGDWDTAQQVLEAGVDEGWEATDQALLLNNLISVLAARGAPTADLLIEFEALRPQVDEPSFDGLYHDSSALVRLAAGDVAGAGADWRRSARSMPRFASPSGTMAARMSLWSGDTDAVEAELELVRTEGNFSRVWRLHADGLEAGVLGLRGGDAGEVAARLRACRDRLLTHGARWDAALIGLDVGFAIGSGDPVARELLEDARAFCVGVRAKPFIALADDLLADSRPGAAPGRRPPDAAGRR